MNISVNDALAGDLITAAEHRAYKMSQAGHTGTYIAGRLGLSPGRISEMLANVRAVIDTGTAPEPRQKPRGLYTPAAVSRERRYEVLFRELGPDGQDILLRHLDAPTYSKLRRARTRHT